MNKINTLAQACGCPVVCSNKGALPEIVGDSALMASPNNYKKLASHLHSILTDSRIRKVLIQKGLDNVNKFNSKRMIQQYCNLYKNLYKRAEIQGSCHQTQLG